MAGVPDVSGHGHTNEVASVWLNEANEAKIAACEVLRMFEHQPRDVLDGVWVESRHWIILL